MEKIAYLNNGQWVLEKAEPKSLDHYNFRNNNPNNRLTEVDALAHQENAYQKALEYNKNSVKKMPNENGEDEDHILLHRGITNYDKKGTEMHNAFNITPTHIEAKDHGVHTLLPDVANVYSVKYPTDENGEEIDGPTSKGKTVSFWVPKSKIHHMGGYTGKNRKPDEHAEEQKHTSVHPGKFKRATPEEVALLNQPLK